MEQIDDELRELSDRLVAFSVWRKLPGEAVGRFHSNLKAGDYLSLINRASLLALSENPAARTLAYEIATHSLGLREEVSPQLVGAVDFLLARLGNFPGRQLLRARYPGAPSTRRPPLLQLEAVVRERENTVPEFGKPLTDFQVDLLHLLHSPQPVSVSAPTSAGKSFVLALQILRRLRGGLGVRIAYIVPTRALIREVMLRLRHELAAGGLDQTSIRCVPQPALAGETPQGVIYVLTQERLLSLLHAAGPEFGLELLVVDEAQGVGEGARGVLLQTAIEHVLRRSPGTEVVFAAPPIANPELFLQLFTRGVGRVKRERHSPVAQNFILVETVHAHPDHLHFTVLRRGKRIPLGARRAKGFHWDAGLLARRAQLAALVTHELDGCLVYANGAWEAEELASELSGLRTNVTVHSDVADFIDYVADQIHAEYPLIRALQQGIAFHHGEMPATVRAGVEDLFRQRKLKFICCTSTLLQGVNLPARHLVVERPRRGNGHPLGAAEFTNLAGRAGRLLREFHGNVWCIEPSNWKQAPRDTGEVAAVHSAFETVLLTDIAGVRRAVHQENYVDRSGDVTAALGRILSEHVIPGVPLLIPANHPAPEEVTAALAEITAMPRQLPGEVYARNSGILPLKLERLYTGLQAEADLEPFLPSHPFQEGAFDRLERIFKLLQENLEGKHHLGYRFDATLSIKWMQQLTLRQIIEGRRKWQEENHRPLTPIPEVIRSVIQAIERRIRFTLVRNLRAYNDVLDTVLREQGRPDEADRLLPLYLYMECGASNQVVLNLISLGFSRTAALLLCKLNLFASDASPERCRYLLMAYLHTLKIPATVRREAEQLLGVKKASKGKPRSSPPA